MSEKIEKCPVCAAAQPEGACELMTVKKEVDGGTALCCCDSLSDRKK